jgi:hypothetical protein
MKWVTRSHVHVDRVACPWLIKRFVDSEAEFVLAGSGSPLTILSFPVIIRPDWSSLVTIAGRDENLQENRLRPQGPVHAG